MADDDLRRAAGIRPPSPASSSEEGATQSATTSATSTAATALGLANQTPRYVTMVCTEDAHVVFGASDVAAATTSDWPLAADVPQTFMIDLHRYGYFRAIQATTGGTIYWYISSD